MYFSSGKITVKTSELLRVERQKMMDERKEDEPDETSEFFKDAFKIKEDATFEDFYLHEKLLNVRTDSYFFFVTWHILDFKILSFSRY